MAFWVDWALWEKLSFVGPQHGVKPFEILMMTTSGASTLDCTKPFLKKVSRQETHLVTGYGFCLCVLRLGL